MKRFNHKQVYKFCKIKFGIPTKPIELKVNNEHFDVAIIGGGSGGLSLAYVRPLINNKRKQHLLT